MNTFISTKKLSVILVLVTALIITLAFQRHISKDKGQTVIRFAGRDQVLANWIAIIAQEKKFWNEDVVHVHYESVARGRDASQALVAGQSDITAMADFSFMLAAHQYKSLRLFASIAQSTNSVDLIGDATLGVHSIQDIVGKSIALSVGSGSQFYVQDLLCQMGIRDNSINIINLEPQALVSAAGHHEVPAMATWQPFSQQITKILGTNGVILHAPPKAQPYNMSFDLVSHAAFLQQHGDIVEQFVKGLTRAQDFLSQHPAEAVSIYAKRTGLKPEIISHMAAVYTFNVSLPRDTILATLLREDDWATRCGFVQSKFSAEEWSSHIDSRFIKP